MSLAGKVAVVSGSSQGIGAAVVRELSKRGAAVAINYPFPDEKVNAEKVKESLGGNAKAIIVEADLSTHEGAKKLAQTVADAFKKIDILVNNAGVILPSDLSATSDTDLDHAWATTINLNCRGTLLLTREVLKYLSPENSRIINIASAIARGPSSGMTIYAGSKGMIETFTRTWASELPARYGCTVNSIAPGPVSTEGVMAQPQAVRDSFKPVMAITPVAKRLAKPEEVGYAVAMLCEEGASWLNGAFIPVTGGSYVN